MTLINIERQLKVPLAIAWEELSDISGHVNWMADAVRIEFSTSQRRGVGTRFVCLTKVGPLSTHDLMEITSWQEGSSIGVRHRGLVRGEGTLTLSPIDVASCSLSWNERLTFPTVLGGGITAAIARPILTKIWSSNLRRFELSALGRLESCGP